MPEINSSYWRGAFNKKITNDQLEFEMYLCEICKTLLNQTSLATCLELELRLVAAGRTELQNAISLAREVLDDQSVSQAPYNCD